VSGLLDAAIPAELRERPQWVLWRYEERDDGCTKVPYQAKTGEQVNAQSNAPGTWTTFPEALRYCQANDWVHGVGFVFAASDPYFGIDLDKCRDPRTGLVEPWALDILARFTTYAEWSVSGTGLHIIGRGTLPPNGRRKGRIEAYDRGRYFTMTGDRVPSAPQTIEPCQDALNAWHAAVWPPEPSAPGTNGTNGHAGAGGSVTLDDYDLLGRMFDGKRGDVLTRLWNGDTAEHDHDDSAADLSLCNGLAFWTGKDPARMDGLFRQSALMRPKWDRRARTGETYGEGTIRMAIASCRESLADSPRGTTSSRPEPEAAPVPRTLVDVHATFRRWLHLPDTGMLDVTLGAVAANRMAGDPTWLMLVSGPSSGKTEVLNGTARLPDVHMAATLTEGALLSGTSKKDAASGARGGLLRVIGSFGILLAKDFTSILAMNRDQRGQLLAALREVYDGSWTRHLGVDGGRTLHWEGKLGVLAGCTAAIDNHHAVMAVMGERFLLYRAPETDPSQQARRALANTGREAEMRRELAAAVSGLFAGLELPSEPAAIDDDETERLVALASLAARARSAVERDSYRREIELIPDPEAPARIAQALRRLYGGMLAVGVDRAAAWRLVLKVGLDCMPKLRRSVFDFLADREGWHPTTAVAAHAGYPTVTARRSLEDLTVHGIVDRKPRGDGKPTDRGDGKPSVKSTADLWRLSDHARGLYAACVSEKSGDAREGGGSLSLKKLNTTCTDFSETHVADDQDRQTSCWRCGSGLSAETAASCERCTWLVCSCGSCSEACEPAEPSWLKDADYATRDRERRIEGVAL